MIDQTLLTDDLYVLTTMNFIFKRFVIIQLASIVGKCGCASKILVDSVANKFVALIYNKKKWITEIYFEHRIFNIIYLSSFLFYVSYFSDDSN